MTNKCKKFMRGNINLSSKSVTKIRCKLFCGCFMVLMSILFSIYWINWDATIVFKMPELYDIKPGFTKEISLHELQNIRWKEKQTYIEEVFHSSCKQYNYALLTNLNIVLLGYQIKDSIVYNCKRDSLHINLRITPKKSTTRLECNETYGNKWTIRKDRFHPLQYSYLNKKTFHREEHKTINYEETCLLYQAYDILIGTWTI